MKLLEGHARLEPLPNQANPAIKARNAKHDAAIRRNFHLKLSERSPKQRPNASLFSSCSCL